MSSPMRSLLFSLPPASFLLPSFLPSLLPLFPSIHFPTYSSIHLCLFIQPSTNLKLFFVIHRHSVFPLNPSRFSSMQFIQYLSFLPSTHLSTLHFLCPPLTSGLSILQCHRSTFNRLFFSAVLSLALGTQMDHTIPGKLIHKWQWQRGKNVPRSGHRSGTDRGGAVLQG